MKLDCYIDKVIDAERAADALDKLLSDANISNGTYEIKKLQLWLQGYIAALHYIEGENTQGGYLEV